MKYVLADSTYDRALRELMSSAAMPGAIRIAFGREPDFFQGLGVQGKQNQALIALEGGRVVGVGCRSIKPVYVNGQPRDFGYLSALRLLPQVRRKIALARGYAALRSLHADGRVPAYLSTIVEGNEEAISLLTSHRAGLPCYEDYGRYLTYALIVGKRRRQTRRDGLKVGLGGQDVPLEEILRFLNAEGRRRQFFPVLDRADFSTPYLRDLQPQDFQLALSGDQIVGVAARWTQEGFKQLVVDGYSGATRLLRPLWSRLCSLAGYGALPRPGERLKVAYAAFVCAKKDDPFVFSVLVNALLEAARGAGQQFLLLGLHERDPLRDALRPFASIRYGSRLYLVYWDADASFCKTIDSQMCPYLELGAL